MNYDNLIPGIVSVTFRAFSADKIIELSKGNGLEAIEWGSDVHLKAGDLTEADRIAKLCSAKNILPISYGSYQGKGESGEDFFAKTIETAAAFGTENIRIWAGAKNSEDVTKEERKEYARYAGKLADMAAEKGLDISFECHKGTLTNTPESAVELIQEIGRKNVYLYWQPLISDDINRNKKIIKMFLPYLKNVHVYAWDNDFNRFALADHEKAWKEYAEAISLDGKKHGMLLEFVKNDSEEQFKRDAETLLKIIR